MMDPAHFFVLCFPLGAEGVGALCFPTPQLSAETPFPHRPVCDAVPSPGEGRILPFRMAQWSSVMTTSTPVHPLNCASASPCSAAERRDHPLLSGAWKRLQIDLLSP